MSIPLALIEQLRAGECVLIVGPDLAAHARDRPGSPASRRLAEILRAQLSSGAQEAGDLPHLAWHYQQAFGRAQLVSLLAEHLNPADLVPLPEHDLIASLPISLILTTALDRSLPLAFEQHGRACQTILATATNAPSLDDSPLIVYLNGCIDTPASLVLTPPEHERAARRRILPTTVTADLARKTILLLGCDLADDAFRQTFQSVLDLADRYGQRAYAVHSELAAFASAVYAELQIEPLQAEPLAFLREVQAAITQLDLGQAPERALAGADASSSSLSRVQTQRRPWKGINFYEEQDAELFFGRTKDQRELVSQILSFRSTVLSGGSGVGKTSLLNAAVTLELRRRGYTVVPFTVVSEAVAALRNAVRAAWPEARYPTSGDSSRGLNERSAGGMPDTLELHVRNQLRQVLTNGLSQGEFETLCFDLGIDGDNFTGGKEVQIVQLLTYLNAHHQIATLHAALSPDLRQEFERIMAAEAAPTASGAGALDQIQPPPIGLPRLVIICDEFEKFFRDEFVPPPARVAFVKEVVGVFARPDLPIKWVFSLRKEAVCELFNYFEAQSRILIANLYNLKPLTREQAAQAIRGPAASAGLAIEPGLLTRLLDELAPADSIQPPQPQDELAPADSIEPPQLQIVCDMLYRQAEERQTNQLTVSDYERVGGAKKILSDYLERVLEAFAPADIRFVKDLLIALAGTQETTLALTVADLAARLERPAAQIELILRRLQDFTIIRQRVTDIGATYELTHAYLIKEIDTWLGGESRVLKEIQSLIGYTTRSWMGDLRAPFSAEALALILPLRDRLRLTDDERRLLWRSAVLHGRFLDEWVTIYADKQQQLAAITSDAPLPKAHVLEAMRRIETQPAITALVGEALKEENEIAMRRLATEQLAMLADPSEAQAMMIEQARAADKQIRARSTHALAIFADKASLRHRLPLKLKLAIHRELAKLRIERGLDHIIYLFIGAALGSLPLFVILANMNNNRFGNIQNYRFEPIGMGAALGLGFGWTLTARPSRWVGLIGAMIGGYAGGIVSGLLLFYSTVSTVRPEYGISMLSAVGGMAILSSLITAIMILGMLVVDRHQNMASRRALGLLLGGMAAGALVAWVAFAPVEPEEWPGFVYGMSDMALIGLGIGLGDYFYQRNKA